MKNKLLLLGPIAVVIAPHVPEQGAWKGLRTVLYVAGGAATAFAAWDAYRKGMSA